MQGVIRKSQSGYYTVETEIGPVVCQLRGRLKKGKRTGDVAAVGDKVHITILEKGRGVIESIEPRQRSFVRLAPTPQGEYQQILIANPDQAVFVFSCAEPEPRLGMLDRYLVTAEKQEVPVIILANKIDLVSKKTAHSVFDLYRSIGYDLIYTSAKNGTGLKTLGEKLTNKISLFTGPSGTGKSSLLNAIQPNLGLEVSQVSKATSKGRHTTVVREMYPLDGGGFVADSPGLKALALFDIEPEEVDGYFPEMRELVAECAFSDCTHVKEPGCAVLTALNDGRFHPERYKSYLHIRFGDEFENILDSVK
jgi:ribosome biogenesis GTPase